VRVRNGLALDWPKYSKGKYNRAQREAERAERGMWSGSYVEPWLYRAWKAVGRKPAQTTQIQACRIGAAGAESCGELGVKMNNFWVGVLVSLIVSVAANLILALSG
jgi:hypothetical protein